MKTNYHTSKQKPFPRFGIEFKFPWLKLFPLNVLSNIMESSIHFSFDLWTSHYNKTEYLCNCYSFSHTISLSHFSKQLWPCQKEAVLLDSMACQFSHCPLTHILPKWVIMFHLIYSLWLTIESGHYCIVQETISCGEYWGF